MHCFSTWVVVGATGQPDVERKSTIGSFMDLPSQLQWFNHNIQLQQLNKSHWKSFYPIGFVPAGCLLLLDILKAATARYHNIRYIAPLVQLQQRFLVQSRAKEIKQCWLTLTTQQQNAVTSHKQKHIRSNNILFVTFGAQQASNPDTCHQIRCRTSIHTHTHTQLVECLHWPYIHQHGCICPTCWLKINWLSLKSSHTGQERQQHPRLLVHT